MARISVIGCVAAALAYLAGCGHGTPPARPSDAAVGRWGAAQAKQVPSPPLGRVAIVVMENHEYGAIVGSRSAPYINRLAREGALATSFYAIGHPSLPNYLALTGGSTFGISEDCTDCTVRARNLVDQLDARAISWKAYMEGLPAPCSTVTEAGRYAKKHDPFLYYRDVTGSPRRCRRVVALSELRHDLTAGHLPRFIWISPDLCHDMHDCSVREGDRFLAAQLPPLLRRLGPRGLLILTWDEGESDRGCCRAAQGGRVATILAGPAARRGVRSSVPHDHYSILRTIEDGWRLPRLGWAGCPCTQPLSELISPTAGAR